MFSVRARMSRDAHAGEPGRRLLPALGRALGGSVVVVMLALVGAAPALAEVTQVTGAADNLRTGWYPDEPSLTPAAVHGGAFKQAFKTPPLKGQIYAQPLVADGTLVVVTEEDWAYGLDPITGEVRWKTPAGTPVEAGKAPIECPDLAPFLGITGTPVIDTEHNVAYFTSNSYEERTGPIAWYMNAVKLDNGEEVKPFPVKIEGTAQNIKGETVTFEAAQQLQRPALLMMNGVVYAGFGSHCDTPPYQGWIAGVSTSGKLETMWATSGKGGSIWQGGSGLVSDAPGQILFSTGNDDKEPGVWDPAVGEGKNPPEGRLGESVVRVHVEEGGVLKATDFFSPFESKKYDEGDLDLGSAGPVALPPQFGTTEKPELLVQEGKDGHVYLLNRNELGGREATENKIVQESSPLGGVWGAAAVWPGDGGYVYIPMVGLPGSSTGGFNTLHVFKYEHEGETPKLSLAAESSEKLAFGSGSPIVTSNGLSSGTAVVWIPRCPKIACKEEKGEGEAELEAYEAALSGNVSPVWRAGIGHASKFSRPYASNGHVYVGNSEGDIIGFSGPALTPASESLELGSTPVGGRLTGKVTLTNTGTELTVKAVRPPSAPFEATELPAVNSVIKPGQSITVAVAFQSSTPGSFKGSLGLTTEAGETNISVSGSAEAPTATTASLSALPAGPVTVIAPSEPPPSLAHLKLPSALSASASRRHKTRLTFTLSTAATVYITIYRRTISHHCPKGARTCTVYVPTKVKLKLAGHASANTVVLNLASLPAGAYRLAATPIASSGARGVTRDFNFTVA